MQEDVQQLQKMIGLAKNMAGLHATEPLYIHLLFFLNASDLFVTRGAYGQVLPYYEDLITSPENWQPLNSKAKGMIYGVMSMLANLAGDTTKARKYAVLAVEVWPDLMGRF